MEYEYNLVNLSVLVDKNKTDIIQFLRYNGIKKFDEYDVIALSNIIPKIDINNRKGFNISYVINKIDKEFDLVKLDTKTIVNIELKISTAEVNQCISNYKIFKKEYPNYDIIIFCYESTTNKLYILNNEEDELKESSFDYLNLILKSIKEGKKIDININVCSVYYEPSVFFEKKYILSESQLDIKNKILADESKISLVAARAGTGKSLLALDLYEYYSKKTNYSVCYLTPFKLFDVINNELIKYCGMETILNYIKKGKKYDICIIDEAQRIKKDDLNKLDSLISKKIILLGDINQNIDWERTFSSLYEDKSNSIHIMNQSIRTDDTFECFARKVLNMSKVKLKNKQVDKKKIQIEMVSGELVNQLSEHIYIEPSKSLYYSDCKKRCQKKTCETISAKCLRKMEPHAIISREYSKVIIYLCDAFNVSENRLCCDNGVCTGNFTSQMYAIMTRAVDELLIITQEIEVFNYMKKKLSEI